LWVESFYLMASRAKNPAFLVVLFTLLFAGTGLVLAGESGLVPGPPIGEETPYPVAAVTPTIDRLASPPTVFPPTQADNGAQLFWLYCQPCHGDQGQGLTDEWRSQYPEDHQNCWLGGCHGKSPYPEGFALPTSVPAVIGEGSLFRFGTMGQVFQYIRAEMPFEHPGVLTDEEYLAITAFLARAHSAGDDLQLTIKNVEQVRLRTIPVAENDRQLSQTEGDKEEFLSRTPEPSGDQKQSGKNQPVVDESYVWMGIILALLLFGGGWIWVQLK
jgi:hypothetical protein